MTVLNVGRFAGSGAGNAPKRPTVGSAGAARNTPFYRSNRSVRIACGSANAISYGVALRRRGIGKKSDAPPGRILLEGDEALQVWDILS